MKASKIIVTFYCLTDEQMSDGAGAGRNLFVAGIVNWLQTMYTLKCWYRGDVNVWLQALAALAHYPDTASVLVPAFTEATKLVAKASNSEQWLPGRALSPELSRLSLAALEVSHRLLCMV